MAVITLRTGNAKRKVMVGNGKDAGDGRSTAASTAYARFATTEVPYLRAGRGAALLVMVDDPLLRQRLVALLAPSNRVLAPLCELCSAAAEISGLNAFIECTGLVRPPVIAAQSSVGAVLRLSMLEPDLFRRILVLGAAATDFGRLPGPGAPSLSFLPVPRSAAALDAVREFIVAGRPPIR